MLTPRQFIERYGRPGVIPVSIPAGGTYTIPSDYDRYVVEFTVITGTIDVTISDGSQAPIAYGTLDVNNPLFQVLHSLEGAVVNLQYQLSSVAGATGVLILGTMIEPRPLRQLEE